MTILNNTPINSQFQVLKAPVPFRVLSSKAVKYGDGDGAYSGHKHKTVYVTGEEFPDTMSLHNEVPLQIGVYDTYVEIITEGKKPVPKLHYIFNKEATAKLGPK